MPLKSGSSRKVVGENISELMHTGRPQKQAVAISLQKSGLSNRKHRADGGSADDYMARNRRWVKPGAESFSTILSPQDEARFRNWVQGNHIPFDPAERRPDYDMRGWWQANQHGDPRASSAVDPNDGRLHYSDVWKTPYHQTFSNESQWATPDAPHWRGDQLVTEDGAVIFDDQKHASGGYVHRAGGGGLSAPAPFYERSEARMLNDPPHFGGLFRSDVAGRTDRLPHRVPADSFVFPAAEVATLGQGNTLAGAKILDAIFGTAPYGAALPKSRSLSYPHVRAEGGNTDGVSHVMVAGGEYLITPDKIAAVGRRLRAAGKSKAKSDLAAGHQMLRDFVLRIREAERKRLKNAPAPKR